MIQFPAKSIFLTVVMPFLKPDRMERPFIFVENGKPAVLSLAMRKGGDSFTVFVKPEE